MGNIRVIVVVACVVVSLVVLRGSWGVDPAPEVSEASVTVAPLAATTPGVLSPPDLPVTGLGDPMQIFGQGFKGGTFFAETILSPKGRSVTFWWRYHPDYQLYDPVEAHVVEQSVWYWPTIADWVSPGELLVGGISPRDGSTVVYSWKYEQVPQKPSFTTLVDPNTGTSTAVWSLPNRTSVTLIYQEAGSAFGGLSMLKRNPGKPDTALVRAMNSGDVYVLDWSGSSAEGTLTLAASSTVSGAGVLYIPALSRQFESYFGLVHDVDGYVFCLGTMRPFPVDRIYMVDADYDGDLDWWLADPDVGPRFVSGSDPGISGGF
jgi:hypothetical protein